MLIDRVFRRGLAVGGALDDLQGQTLGIATRVKAIRGAIGETCRPPALEGTDVAAGVGRSAPEEDLGGRPDQGRDSGSIVVDYRQ